MAWDVDPDPLRARTPPARLYREPELHAQLLERALRPSWQWVGDADDLAQEVGAVVPATRLPGSDDEALLLTHGEDGALHALPNVCTHRGHPLALEPCRLRELRCGYHGRRFALDGACKGQPFLDGTPGFPAEEDRLARLGLERFGPWLFAAPADAPSLAAAHPCLAERLGGWPLLDQLARDPRGDRDYEVAADWALYVENYLEGLHVPFVHPGLQAALDPGDYRVLPVAGGVVQVGGAPAGEPSLELPDGHPDGGQGPVAALYLWLFPNTMLNVYPWGVSLNAVDPLGPGRCRVRYARYLARPELLERGAGGDLDQVEAEDQAVVEAVQRNVNSQHFRRGRYVPGLEAGTHHFHRLLTRALETGRGA